jgi:molybdopterin converting factor small subunit
VKVTVRVVGHAVEFFPGRKDRYELELDGPTSVAGIIDRLGVGRALVMSAIAGGKRRDLDYVPADGEEVILITPPAGG